MQTRVAKRAPGQTLVLVKATWGRSAAAALRTRVRNEGFAEAVVPGGNVDEETTEAVDPGGAVGEGNAESKAPGCAEDEGITEDVGQTASWTAVCAMWSQAALWTRVLTRLWSQTALRTTVSAAQRNEADGGLLNSSGQ